MTTYTIEPVGGAVASERDCWGVFAPVRVIDNGQIVAQRVYGPANLYDCALERARLVSAERHGEPVVVPSVAEPAR